MNVAQRNFKPPDGGYGWIIVGACIVLHSSLFLIILCFGMIYETKFTDMNVSASQISLLLHLNNSLMCTLGIFSGPLLKKFDYRQVTLFGTSLCCLAIFLTTFAHSYAYLICTISILLGIGNGILMPGTYMAVNSFFEKKLTLAISFQVTGSSIVGIFMPQVCNLLLNEYGVHGTILILAGLSFHAIPCAMLLRPVKTTRGNVNSHKPNQQEAPNDQNGVADKLMPVYKNTTTPKQNGPETSFLSSITKTFSFELLTERTYLILVIGMGISFASELNTILMTPFALIELSGFDRTDLATAVSLQAITDVTGRLLVPFIAYKSDLSPKVTYSCSLIGLCASRLILSLFYHNKVLSYVSVAVLGLGKGSKAVFQALILPKYVTFDKLAAGNGLLMVINGMLSLIVGPIIGLTHDLTNSYIYSLHTSTILSLSCVIMWAVEYLQRPRRKDGNCDLA